MPIQWIPAANPPDEGDVVLVANRNEVWTTRWKHALADEALKAPVRLYANAGELGLPFKLNPNQTIGQDKELSVGRTKSGYWKKR